MEWILLFGLPLVISPSGLTEIPKVIVAEIFVGLLWLRRIWQGGTLAWGRLWPLLVMLGYILVRGGEAVGNGYRLQGIVLQLILVIWAIWAADATTHLVPRRVVWVTLVLVALGMIFGQTNASGRAIGTLGEPNALASVFVFSWPFAGPLAALFALGVAVFAMSRSALVAWVVQISVWGVVMRLNKPIKTGVLVGLGLLILALGLPYLDKNRIWENRTQVWETAFVAGLQNPIFGWGFGNVEQAIATTAKKLNNTVQYQRVDSAHNIVLDYWIQGGIVGLGCWLLVVGYGFLGLIKKDKKVEAIAFLGLFTTMCFNPASVVALVQFWWLLGLGMV